MDAINAFTNLWGANSQGFDPYSLPSSGQGTSQPKATQAGKDLFSPSKELQRGGQQGGGKKCSGACG